MSPIVSINKTTTPVQVANQPLIRTPSGTTIQRKTIPTTSSVNTQQQRTASSHTRTIGQAPTTAGRMIIPRQTATATTAVRQQKAVTPEQKILQLSKSGDLKVTKKVMTREDVLAQRANQQQNLRQQQQARQQSQVHIQKVQQLSGPAHKSSTTATTTSTTTRKQQLQRTAPSQAEEEHQAQLCPITGMKFPLKTIHIIDS